jgi:chromosomal replication initiator protein
MSTAHQPPMLRSEQRAVFRRVIKATASVTQLDAATIIAHHRDRDAVDARHVAMWAVRELSGASFPSIAKLFGGYDHSTVMNACSRVARQIEGGGLLRRLAAGVLHEMTQQSQPKEQPAA